MVHVLLLVILLGLLVVILVVLDRLLINLILVLIKAEEFQFLGPTDRPTEGQSDIYIRLVADKNVKSTYSILGLYQNLNFRQGASAMSLCDIFAYI